MEVPGSAGVEADALALGANLKIIGRSIEELIFQRSHQFTF